MLELRCFNGFQVTVEKRPLTRFYSQKTRALLAYLAATAGQQHQRSHLSGLLWPDYSEKRARRNLSQTLTSLRKDLGEGASLLQSSHRTIRLANEDGLVVDVLDFAAGQTAVRQHDHTDLLTCPTCTQTLQKTADIYSGPFLNHFAIDDSPLFENWIITERERLLQQAIEVLTRLSNSYAAQGQGEAALATVQRLLELAPWQESAHRQRMLLLAQQGQRIQALAQYDVLADVLMAELGVTPSVETDLLYDQILAGEIEPIATQEEEPAIVAPARPAPPFHAPAVSPHFVGRDAELAKISQLLSGNGRKISHVALVGMGGIGKTAVATYVAQQLKDQFVDGVLWGNSKTSDAHNILNLWAQAYGNDFSGIGDLESKAAAVRNLLINKRTLVVLDNVDDAAAVRPLLPNCEQCAVLMTTRNLDIATALNAQPISLTELEPNMSQQLFIRILGEARVMSTPEEAAAATKIGELLHHLPLALEIAAKRLLSRPRMRLAALARRLEDTQQRLGLAISDQAIRASFQVSWEGLTQVAKQVFAAMAVFSGRPFTPEALAAAANLDLFDTEDELYTLAALSLVSEQGETRYQQHPLLADFAGEKLGDELEETNGRFATYYLSFAQENGTNLEALEPEWENLNAAIQAASNLQQWQAVLDFTDALAESWFKYGRFHDANQIYPLAKTAAEKQSSQVSLAQTLLRWAEINIEQSHYNQAWERLEAALHLFYQLEDDVGVAKSKYFQGFILHDQGRFQEAKPLLRESQKLEADLGNIQAEALATNLLAWVHLQTEPTTQKAEDLANRAKKLLEPLANEAGLIPVLNLLAVIAARNNNLETAENLAQQSLSLSQLLNIPAETGYAQQLLATILSLQERYEEAELLAQQSLALLRKLGNRRFEGMVLMRLSRTYLAVGKLHQAKRATEQALTIFRQLEDRLGYGYALLQLGDISVKLNQLEQANEAWHEAQQIANYLNHAYLRSLIDERLSD